MSDQTNKPEAAEQNGQRRTYLVTGSLSGIGAAVRSTLEAGGHRVVGVDLRAGAEIQLDLAAPEQAQTLSAKLDTLGVDVIDGLFPGAGISNAGGNPGDILRLNYFGAVATYEQCLPHLLRSRAPRVCTILSIGLLTGDDGAVVEACLGGDPAGAIRWLHDLGLERNAYGVGKRALAHWTRRAAISSIALDHRILINGVAPAFIRTPMTQATLDDPEVYAARVKTHPHPLGPGRPEDVSGLVDYLLSPSNSFVTGQIIFIDGGHEATMRAGAVPAHRGVKA